MRISTGRSTDSQILHNKEIVNIRLDIFYGFAHKKLLQIIKSSYMLF